MKKILLFSTLIICSLVFSGCGTKKSITEKVTPTPIPQTIELKDNEKPYISLIPRTDGHEIKLKIEKIPSFITQIEYELLYTAQDNGLEIEKGVGDTVKVSGSSVERDLLLGTASCTNGCKYKYDTGITGGTLSLVFITSDGQTSTFETSFTLKSGADLKKEGNSISLKSENFSTPIIPKTEDFYILLKNPLVFSLFSSSKNLVADYPIK